jgi:hypothetical protein
MAVSKFQALQMAVEVVKAAAQANALKLEGVPYGEVADAVKGAEKDAAYIATLLDGIADKIKTTD